MQLFLIMRRLRSNTSASCSVRILLLACSVLPIAVCSSPAVGEEPSDLASGDDFYLEQVKPILTANCYKCHGGAAKIRGGLNLTHREGIVEGGDSGPAYDVDAPDASYLLSAVRYEDFEMPPKGQMTDNDIAVLERWVELGLPFPESEPRTVKHSEPEQNLEVNDENKQFWSFLPIVRPAVPTVTDGEWVATPIDAYVLARLDEQGIRPAPPASRESLLRRACYDLTGLPPSPAEVREFLDDDHPDAFERLIDRLLESPHYGEKWGRHWLDLVRYAETNSFERDSEKPFVWRFRDYVIESFNDDKPYDQFVREQLAGDELENPTPESIIATAYYRLGTWDDEPADPKQSRLDDLDGIISTTAQVFLGLTVNCARCHDHKIDPIPQADYYRFLAFFNNVRHYGERSRESVLDASVGEIAIPDEYSNLEEQMQEYELKLSKVTKSIESIESKVVGDFIPVEHEEFKYERNRIDLVKSRVDKLITDKEFKRYVNLLTQRDLLRNNRPSGMAQALCVKEHGSEPPETHLLIRGNAHAPGQRVDPGFPQILSPPEAEIRPAPSGLSTGQRTALANWITARDNQLTARVMVNRIWQYHFGRGLVRSPNDFGFGGVAPTHPELLDYLASEFMDGHWKIKRIHKLIMMSNVYQMAHTNNDKAYAVDPANDLFWRFDIRRLSGEEIRDSILAVNGSLNQDKMFGPSIYTVIPQEVLAGQSKPGAGWGVSTPEDRNRRSVYIHVKRSLITPLLESFDYADTDSSCPVRFVTIQPTQALGMLNSEFINREAGVFAEYLQRQAPDHVSKQVKIALNRVTQREPTSDEIARAVALIDSLQEEEGLEPIEALTNFCVVALNLNEFFYLD